MYAKTYFNMNQQSKILAFSKHTKRVVSSNTVRHDPYIIIVTI